MSKVAVIGIGRMGAAMADTLSRAGFDLVLHNRTAATAEALASTGSGDLDLPAVGRLALGSGTLAHEAEGPVQRLGRLALHEGEVR